MSTPTTRRAASRDDPGRPAGTRREVEHALVGLGIEPKHAMLDRIGDAPADFLVGLAAAAPDGGGAEVVRLNGRAHDDSLDDGARKAGPYRSHRDRRPKGDTAPAREGHGRAPSPVHRRRVQCGAGSAELLTNAIRVPSGDHDGTLIVPWPPYT